MAHSVVALHCASAPPLFPDMETGALDLEGQGMLVKAQRVMRIGIVVFRVQGKYLVEDLDAMHDQPKDDRLGEVLPSNRPHVEHQGFVKEDTVLKNRRPEAQFVS